MSELTIERARIFDPRTDEVRESSIHISDGSIVAIGGDAPDTGRPDIGRAVVDAALLSGVRVERVRILTFALSGAAAGVGGAISVSRVATGSAQNGDGVALQAIAAIILGGTSVYGGEGAVWRSLAGVMLLALINNGFNILNANPFYKDLTTGAIIVLAVALSAGAGRR